MALSEYWWLLLVDYAKIHRLVLSDDAEERNEAVDQITNNFKILIYKEKEQASKDLLALTKDPDSDVRWHAACALGSAFQYITDKDQAWKDLLELRTDSDNDVRWSATDVLGSAFPYLTEKKQAWKDLLTLTKNPDSGVRWGAADVLGSAFPHLTEKEQAWKDLLTLTKNPDSGVRRRLGDVLGSAFPYLTEKKQATKDLLTLTEDQGCIVRRGSVVAISSAFPHLTDKKQATINLLALTEDPDSNVRMSANHSLGKISIYKATSAGNTETLQSELEKAIDFFEKASQESRYSNPSSFCLPFYRSYNAVIFRHKEAEKEIDRNLEEAKHAVVGSESKVKLLEAVGNLANALLEAQKLRDLDDIKSDLNAYRRYCDRTVELLDETKDKAPGAANLVRRGLPIIDEQIKEIIAEIQEKTKVLCIETKDSPLEDIGKEVNKIGQNLLRVRDPIGLEKSVNNLEIALSDICNRMVGIEKGDACELLEREKNEQYIEDKLPLMSLILSKVSSQITNKQKLGIREELVISVGGTVFGTGAQHVITIPLQEIAYDDLKHDLKKIGSKDVFDLATLPPKLAEKVNQYIDKIKGKR